MSCDFLRLPSPTIQREDRRSTSFPPNCASPLLHPISIPSLIVTQRRAHLFHAWFTNKGGESSPQMTSLVDFCEADSDAGEDREEDESDLPMMASYEYHGGRMMENHFIHLEDGDYRATQSYAKDPTFSIETCIQSAPKMPEKILFRLIDSVFQSRRGENLLANVAQCLEDIAAAAMPREMDQSILQYGEAFSKFQGRKGKTFGFDAFRDSYSQTEKDQDRNICKSLLVFFRMGKRKEAREWLKKKEQHWRVASMWGSGELWKAACRHLARDQSLFPEEQAVYGLLCGDFHALFETCKTWEDALWALCSCFSIQDAPIHTWQGMMGTLDSFLKDAGISISEEDAFYFECTKRFICGLCDEEAENNFWEWLETQASKEESEPGSYMEESRYDEPSLSGRNLFKFVFALMVGCMFFEWCAKQVVTPKTSGCMPSIHSPCAT
jgi:hypothetical protein